MCNVDTKDVVKHLVNGSLAAKLCRICLEPLSVPNENIYTKISKGDREFSVADVLDSVCGIQLSGEDYNVCMECFLAASMAYRFYLTSKRSEEILNFYVSEIESSLSGMSLPDEENADTICISLPLFEPSTELFDFDMEKFITNNLKDEYNVDVKHEISPRKNYEEITIKHEAEYHDNSDNEIVIIKSKDSNETVINKKDLSIKQGKKVIFNEYNDISSRKRRKYNEIEVKTEVESDSNNNSDSEEEIVVIKSEDGSLQMITKRDFLMRNEKTVTMPKRKLKKTRNLTLKSCTRCPVKYRFVKKLQYHMKNEHDIDLFICKVCSATTEDESEFNDHLNTHNNIHRCNLCNAIFKKRDTLITHLKCHENSDNLQLDEYMYVCEMCGHIAVDEDSLLDHKNKKHDKKYTCFYCGKMYKMEVSLETHIKKHEMHMKNKDKAKLKSDSAEKRKDECVCTTCGKKFVDDRALLWHSRLHTNERPYKCNVCGRGFISLNRRNQHAVCSHTQPTKRCPLCPALFHMRSMVNTHLKKVHLNTHKRHRRHMKRHNVYWRTEPVPIQELSVSIQNQILELQSAQKNGDDILNNDTEML